MCVARLDPSNIWSMLNHSSGYRARRSSLSAYEKERLSNIARNRAHLIALGIEEDVSSLRDATKKQRAPLKGSAINKKNKNDAVPPRSRSLRLQNLDTDGVRIADKPVIEPPVTAPRAARKPSVPLDAAKVSTGATSPEAAAAFLTRLGEADPAPEVKKAKKGKAAMCEFTAPFNALEQKAVAVLAVAEDDIAKLVPERIFSLEVHPSPTKLLVAAGDTWGRVGLWDVQAGDDTPVVTFEPHSRPVAGMRIAPHQPHLLLSCSHDGSVRCLDLGGGGAGASFTEIYRAPEDSDGDYPMLHGFSRTATEGGSLALARSDGKCVLLDPRVASSAGHVQQLHEKKIFCVDVSPNKPFLLASSSLDRSVALWDVRTFGDKKAKPLTILEHGLSVTSARFSSSGQRLLTTCNDDLLRVYDGHADKDWTLRTAIKHNNKTGRYITSFQAEWLRGSDERVLCGSLGQPRGIDVFSARDGAALERLEDDNVTSVVSLLAQHPSRPALVASNSGGKCFVWR